MVLELGLLLMIIGAVIAIVVNYGLGVFLIVVGLVLLILARTTWRR